ncbi:MAG: STAS/SEC14 domain-containing protein [Flavobacterium sp. 38-13]|uniref:STAS/SEC14 domain-containing protein n=1 Tax=Flavobacterium sp. 38-13 TaxID=1896168 RepID=UPI0009627D4D|nr:STAS/SEC14 domain-containing protein [Flavobacterium sp. 38-13]OJX49778.1 MAG: STAS/SEC14 domain-containing protein [Flavobacterium sp. 38-13]
MIEILPSLPKNIAAFRATGKVTKEDYQKVMAPRVNELVSNTGELNFFFLIDTELGDFTLGAWFQDALLGLKHLASWKRAAIVIDSPQARKFTDEFSILAPGEFRGYPKEQYSEALEWVTDT